MSANPTCAAPVRHLGVRWFAALACAGALGLLAGCGTAPVARPPAAVYPAATAPAPPQAQAATIHALGLVGTPYRYGGNTPASGFDCSGLIGYVYWQAAQIRVPRTVQQIGNWGQPVSGDALRTGDLVVFGGSGRAATHAGIYVGEGRFVHAPSTGGTVRMDHLASRYWSAQPVSFRRP